MTLEALEISFQVRMGDALEQLRTLGAGIQAVGRQADKARSAGYALSQGVAGGIRAGRSLVVSAAGAVARAAVDKLKASLKIKSPSRVAWEMGDQFSRGFALGTLNSAAAAGAASRTMALDAADALRGGISETEGAGIAERVASAIASVQLRAPLIVDGVKLGEAAIRGINAVTRATGRQLIEI